MSEAPSIAGFLGELGLSSEETARIEQYYGLLWQENQVQNLTRLIEGKEFVEGHVLDVLELRKSGLVDFPAMDLGSGAGVPGLLWAALGSGPWILCDSEKMKAQWLDKAANQMGLENVRALGDRAEAVLKTMRVQSVVARAVGPVDRIFAWIEGCSTWNNLVLLKGPAWDEEWAKFQQSRWRNQLRIAGTHSYTVGADQKKRLIVRLERVPRGTWANKSSR